MVRYSYIYNQVLQIYKNLTTIQFPIEPDSVVASVPNCRTLTYQKFAEVNGCSLRDVILLCESKSGCTHYDILNNRYLVLWNEDSSENNVAGRKRWTKAHELGHVLLNHLPLVAEPKLAENGFNNLSTSELEGEADQFAAAFLCPMPLFNALSISSPVDVKRVFGLSAEASMRRWGEYLNWQRYHRKTAWENDIKRLFVQKGLT